MAVCCLLHPLLHARYNRYVTAKVLSKTPMATCHLCFWSNRKTGTNEPQKPSTFSTKTKGIPLCSVGTTYYCCRYFALILHSHKTGWPRTPPITCSRFSRTEYQPRATYYWGTATQRQNVQQTVVATPICRFTQIVLCGSISGDKQKMKTYTSYRVQCKIVNTRLDVHIPTQNRLRLLRDMTTLFFNTHIPGDARKKARRSTMKSQRSTSQNTPGIKQCALENNTPKPLQHPAPNHPRHTRQSRTIPTRRNKRKQKKENEKKSTRSSWPTYRKHVSRSRSTNKTIIL